jgi:hypothetical protein
MSVGGCVSRLFAEMIEIDENDKIETVVLDVVGDCVGHDGGASSIF